MSNSSVNPNFPSARSDRARTESALGRSEFGPARRLAFLAAAAALPFAGARAQPAPARFVFGAGPAPAGWTLVTPETAYSGARGYGFDRDSSVRAAAAGAEGCTSDRSFFFSVRLPEGNYNVTVRLGDAAAESDTTVKAESRRLMLERIQTAAGDYATRTFTVNVRTPALPPSGELPTGTVLLHPREQGVLDWDDKLTLEFSNTHPWLDRLEITPAPQALTIFLVGDSTVTDQPLEPWNSWGQMLPRFFQPGLAVANNAESGETLKAFVVERRLEKVLSQIKAGDYLFMQFGHNDMKRNWPATYADAFTTYKAYLKLFIAEARLRGAIPVLVTPVNRRTFNSAGVITNSLGSYPEAVRQVAAEEKVALIDLNRMSKTFYEALGPDAAKRAFVDGTHHDNYGSYELARCVVEGIKAAKLGLADELAPDAGSFDPAHPDPLAGFDVPPSPGRDTKAPLGN
jgi:lysophospholipase L1-like esterase